MIFCNERELKHFNEIDRNLNDLFKYHLLIVINLNNELTRFPVCNSFLFVCMSIELEFNYFDFRITAAC